MPEQRKWKMNCLQTTALSVRVRNGKVEMKYPSTGSALFAGYAKWRLGCECVCAPRDGKLEATRGALSVSTYTQINISSTYPYLSHDSPSRRGGNEISLCRNWACCLRFHFKLSDVIRTSRASHRATEGQRNAFSIGGAKPAAHRDIHKSFAPTCRAC